MSSRWSANSAGRHFEASSSQTSCTASATPTVWKSGAEWTATLGGVHFNMVAGSAVIVPPDVDFALSNPYGEPFEAVAVIAIGGQARMSDGVTFTPPWAE